MHIECLRNETNYVHACSWFEEKLGYISSHILMPQSMRSASSIGIDWVCIIVIIVVVDTTNYDWLICAESFVFTPQERVM